MFNFPRNSPDLFCSRWIMDHNYIHTSIYIYIQLDQSTKPFCTTKNYLLELSSDGGTHHGRDGIVWGEQNHRDCPGETRVGCHKRPTGARKRRRRKGGEKTIHPWKMKGWNNPKMMVLEDEFLDFKLRDFLGSSRKKSGV